MKLLTAALASLAIVGASCAQTETVTLTPSTGLVQC